MIKWFDAKVNPPPKDGTRILICQRSKIGIASWGNWTDAHGNDWELTECWCIYDSEDAYYSHLVYDKDITHWMPLPEPLQQSEG